MSQADVDLIRALIPPSETDVAALLRSDELWSQLVEGLKPLVDPEVESVAVWQGGRTHTGFEGFRQMWLDWLEPWARYHSHVDELIDAGDCVVTIARDRGERPDVDGEVDILAGSTWEIRDGKVVRVVFYGNREDALAAAGIEER
jgi:ketosteroid isomerase-like protein